ncbi:aminotransferase class I/II-fold pyridoxal phosphate-dependent enzyme [Clostridiales bacterium COT073_COT-073]|nr:aminotransferase class I/II-fold pyridoxal phosphate-dependent enzyme [Clostridiales bacterium COT073_COT-073]
MQKLFANRISGERIGKKDIKNRLEEAKQKYQAEKNKHIIDLSISEPDAMADFDVIGSLAYEAGQWGNRGCAGNGIIEFKEAAAAYLQRQFKVEGLNPVTEVNHALGTKTALSQLAQVFINPGDVVLSITPAENALTTMAKWLGGEVFELALTAKNKFLPDLESIPAEVIAKAKLLYLQYPNSPSGAIATKAFFKRVVKFAKANQIAVIHDAGYAALVYDDNEPLSFLAIPGAKQVGVEIHSLSEAFNMTGWRLAFVAGNAKIIQAFAAVKNVSDSGQFKAIQRAGITALYKSEITDVTRAKYSRRLEQLVHVFKEMGFAAEKPKATYYLYLAAPKATKDGIKFKNAYDFAEYFIEQTGIVVAPFDENGAYIRISATFQALEQEEYGVYEDIRYRTQGLQLLFK